MTYGRKSLVFALVLGLAACGENPDETSTDQNRTPASDETGSQTDEIGQPADPDGEITIEGRIAKGVECPIIRTRDGDTYAIAMGEADFGPGEYVRMTGPLADMSFCQQGDDTIEPRRIESIEPPARDRDPARAGGIKLTEDYLTGAWVAKGVDADCDTPDFSVSRSPGALVMEADIDGHDPNAAIILGDYPRLDLDEPMPDLPMESRGPDGVAILRPATDAAYDPVRIGSAEITGDGVVFVKCRG